MWGEGKLTAEEERRCSRGSGRITTKSNGNGNHPGENDEDVGVVGAERPRGQQRRREGAAAVGMDRDNSYVPPPPRLSLPPQTSTTPAEDGDRKPEDLSLLTAGKLNGWARAHVDEEDCSEDFEKASTSERGSHKTCSTQWSEMESTLSGTSSGFSMLQAGEEGGSGGAGGEFRLFGCVRSGEGDEWSALYCQTPPLLVRLRISPPSRKDVVSFFLLVDLLFRPFHVWPTQRPSCMVRIF